MANLLVKDIEQALLTEVNYAAGRAGLTQREWVIERLSEATRETGDLVRKSAAERPVEVSERTKVSASSSLVSEGSKQTREAGSGQPRGVRVGAEKSAPATKTKKLTVEEFFKLSNSEQDRARREGRF